VAVTNEFIVPGQVGSEPTSAAYVALPKGWLAPERVRERVAAVVVARERVASLEEQFTALDAQTRPPDELVVVDSDATRKCSRCSSVSKPVERASSHLARTVAAPTASRRELWR
jgi:hypothetical protein